MKLTTEEKLYLHTIIQPGSNLYYATRFIDNKIRDWQLPIYALYETLMAVPDTCSDPGVARIKLHWWMEQCHTLSEESAEHPLLKILHKITQAKPEIKNQFAPLFQSALFKLECLYFDDDASFDAHHQKARGALTLSFAALDTHSNDSADANVLKLAECINLAERLLHLHRDTRHGRCLLPPEQLLSHNVDFNLQQTTNLGAVLLPLYQRCQEHYHAIKDIHYCSALTAEKIYCHLLISTLNVVQNELVTLRNQQISLSPLRKCWIAWRCTK